MGDDKNWKISQAITEKWKQGAYKNRKRKVNKKPNYEFYEEFMEMFLNKYEKFIIDNYFDLSGAISRHYIEEIFKETIEEMESEKVQR